MGSKKTKNTIHAVLKFKKFFSQYQENLPEFIII